MKLVLFDIDGTLLGTDGAGRRAIHRALLDETGTAGPIEQYRFDGKTDPQIIGELLALGAQAALGGARPGALPGRGLRLGFGPPRRPARRRRRACGRAHRSRRPRERRDRAGGYARRRGLRTADRRALRRGRDRVLRRRGAARRRRRLRVRDARRHGPRARRHLRVSAATSARSDELEVKARVEDPHRLRAALARAGAALEFQGDMLDRRFDREGGLATRDEVLRLRMFRPADGTPAYGVLGWKGPQARHPRYRRRAEAETRVADPEATVTILERLGFAASLRIDRRVEIYRLRDAVLRLEWYPAMDVLLEVEGEPDDIERAIAATGLARDRFLAESLPYFVAAYERRTGQAAVLAR